MVGWGHGVARESRGSSSSVSSFLALALHLGTGVELVSFSLHSSDAPRPACHQYSPAHWRTDIEYNRKALDNIGLNKVRLQYSSGRTPFINPCDKCLATYISYESYAGHHACAMLINDGHLTSRLISWG